MDYAYNCGKPKWHSFKPILSWKGKFMGLRHCLTKCAIESKLLNQNCWSSYHFSQEKIPHPLISFIASITGKYVVPFYWATLYVHKFKFKIKSDLNRKHIILKYASILCLHINYKWCPAEGREYMRPAGKLTMCTLCLIVPGRRAWMIKLPQFKNPIT